MPDKPDGPVTCPQPSGASVWPWWLLRVWLEREKRDRRDSRSGWLAAQLAAWDMRESMDTLQMERPPQGAQDGRERREEEEIGG